MDTYEERIDIHPEDKAYLQGYEEGLEDGLNTRDPQDILVGSVVLAIVAVAAFTLGYWA